MKFLRKSATVILNGGMLLMMGNPAAAREAQPEKNRTGPEVGGTDQSSDDSAANSSSHDIIVTGTKSRRSSTVQNAALTVSAFGQEQLQGANVVAITDVAKFIPNVHLDGGANNTQNNYAIRGMGIYTSVPTSTPTVGVFVDGIYLGTNSGTALKNMIDIEGIEVLRGPQGLLFGRNVTAGAILVRTAEPSDNLVAKAEIGIESGPFFQGAALVSGPLDADGTWSGKISVAGSQDNGWFYNSYKREKLGESTFGILRAALKYSPSSDFTTVLRAEAGSQKGDNAPYHNNGKYGRKDKSFIIETDFNGFNDSNWQSATLESRLNVGFGQGQIINIAGFRKIDADAGSDVDGTPTLYFNDLLYQKHKQWSDELRYAGVFGPVSLTVGAYYYKDRLDFFEIREFASGALRTGGGIQNSSTWAIFSNFDVSVLSNLTLNLGARYSGEKKRVRVAAIVAPGSSNPCSNVTLSCSAYAFTSSGKWNAFTPKLGLQWKPSDLTNIYGYWTKGYRSGGYNIRQTNPLATPDAYDQEVESTFEIGIKQQTADRRGRFTLAAFQNKFKTCRETSRPLTRYWASCS